MKILDKSFFNRDCLEVAPELAGKILCVRQADGSVKYVRITETEAYRGEEDTACHASKGRTPRTEILYGESGKIYVYLCYGMHWLMNVITGEVGTPQGVLFRAGGKPLDEPSAKALDGPAKLTRYLGVDKRFNNENLYENPEIWIADDGKEFSVRTDKRVGISYATEEFINKPWRFIIDEDK